MIRTRVPLALLVLSICGVNEAATQVFDDFESGDLSPWEIVSYGHHSGTVHWKLVADDTTAWQGEGGYSVGGGNSVAYRSDFSGSDVAVAAMIKPREIRNRGHHSGVVVRFVDTDNFYALIITGEFAHAVTLFKRVNGVITHLAGGYLPDSVLGVWTSLRLEVAGHNLRVFVNDDLYYEVTDDTHAEGSVGLTNAAAVTRFDDFEASHIPIATAIDVKPGSDPNCFNIDGNGVIPVAILGNTDFDVSQIDALSLTFDGLAVRVRGKRGPLCSEGDSNGDGQMDLVCHFEDDAEYWVGGGDTGTVTGVLWDGTEFEGFDSICVVP